MDLQLLSLKRQLRKNKNKSSIIWLGRNYKRNSKMVRLKELRPRKKEKKNNFYKLEVVERRERSLRLSQERKVKKRLLTLTFLS
jgi:hypothetical protein